MPHAPVNDLELYYETFGDPADPPLLLVMGLGGQAIGWDVEFCQGLVDRGFFVIRFDNRDVGLSTKIESDLEPLGAIMAAFTGEKVDAPYRIADMANDAVGLLDHLGIDRAHIAGASMGGMIVQQLAIDHSHRVLTLTSVMSTTGDPDVGQPTPDALAVLMRPRVGEREEIIAGMVESTRTIGSPEHFDEERVQRQTEAAYDRCFYVEGVMRQLLAVLSSPSRTEGLRGLDVPALVIHGDADPLVTPSGGERTAEAIPDAKFLLIEGMGHDSNPVFWPAMIEAITSLALQARADA